MSDAMLRMLGFHRIDEFTKIDDFERHLSRLFESGAYVFLTKVSEPCSLVGSLSNASVGLRLSRFMRGSTHLHTSKLKVAMWMPHLQ